MKVEFAYIFTLLIALAFIYSFIKAINDENKDNRKFFTATACISFVILVGMFILFFESVAFLTV